MEETRRSFSGINENNLKLPIKKNVNFPLVIILSLLIFVTVVCAAFAGFVAFYPNVYPGISFNGTRLDWMTYGDVRTLLLDWSQDMMDQELTFKYEDVTVSATASQLVEDYDVDGTLKRIYRVGHEGNIIKRCKSVLSAMFHGFDVPPSYTINQSAVEELVSDFTNKVKCAAQPAGYQIRGSILEVYAGLQGVDVDPEEVREMLLDRLVNPSTEPLTPTVEVVQLPVDVDAIYKEIHTEKRDAYVEPDGKGGYTIVPEVVGVDFDVNVLRSRLKAGSGETITVPLEITEPDTTADKLKGMLFADLLGAKTTTLDASLVNRTNNVRLSAEKINGTVLFPGESFSFNDVVGERTVENGFREAKIYLQNEIVDGVGGGICQTTSTLYSAVLRANLQVDQRRSHRFTVAYISLGEDATVYWRSVDFKFTNNSPYPILIKATQKSNYVNVEIWGTKSELNEYDIEIVNKTVKSTPFSTVTKVDPSMKPGTSKVTQNGSNGYTVETYKVYKKDGNEVKREFLHKSVYYPADKIVMVGPEPESNPSTDPNTNPNPDPAADPSTNPTTDPGTTTTPETTDPEAGTGGNGESGQGVPLTEPQEEMTSEEL